MAGPVRVGGPPLEAPHRLPPLPSGRLAWIDNLRVVVITGVILTHVATAYVLDIDWYYEERTAGIVTKVIAGALVGPGALVAMAALFLVSGLLSQRSLARRGPGRFVRDRLLRLGIPLVVYVALIGPLASVIGQRAEGDPSAARPGRFFLSQVRRADVGPLWFVVALLSFSAAYAGLRRLRPAPPVTRAPLRPWHLALAGGAIVIATFLVRLVWPFAGDTPLSLNLWEWPQMATTFTLGALAGERAWLDPMPEAVRRLCGRVSLAGILGVPVVAAAVAVTGDEAPFLGGWHWQALAEPVLEAAFGVGLSLWALRWFADHGNHEGPLARSLGRASFGAYVLHPLVVVALSAALSSVAIAADAKFVVVAALGVPGSFLAGWGASRVPVVDRVL